MQIRSGEKRGLSLGRAVTGDLDPAELEAVVIDADLLLHCLSDIRIDRSLRRAAAMKALDVGSEAWTDVFDIYLPLARERLLEERPLRIRDDVNDQFVLSGGLSEKRDRRRERLPILRGGNAKAGVIVLNLDERLQPLLIGPLSQQPE